MTNDRMKTLFPISLSLPNAYLRHSSLMRFASLRAASGSLSRCARLAIRHLLGAFALAPLLALAAPDQPPPADIAPQPADNAPLAFPLLEHYSKLWENSMFTTKSLPPPDDAPKGPIFTDNLTLAGTYEVDGSVVGVLLDKTTSQVMEVRIGDENEAGIKIVRVTASGAPDKARLQLQKGDQVGWVSIASEAAPPDQAAPGTVGGPGPGNAPGASPMNGGQPQPNGSAIPGRPIMPAGGSIPGGAIPPGVGANTATPVQPIRPPVGNGPRGIPGAAQAQGAGQPNPILPAIPPSAAAAAPPASDDIPLPPQ